MQDPSPQEAPAETPLRWPTPVAWVEVALTDLPVFLNDHAHLERKAASNALELLGRWPWPVDVHGGSERAADADRWSRVLASIARDEVRHLAQVLPLLVKHGGQFERCHANPYAAGLRGLVRKGQGHRELIDRLLVSALIEARSGERFELLAAHAPDASLRRFYGSLVASERGHYHAFIELAALIEPESAGIEARWAELLDAEALLVSGLPAGSTMHSGAPAGGAGA